MKVILASLLFVALWTLPAFSSTLAEQRIPIPDFTISTTTPERAIYSIVKYLHEHAFLIRGQTVVIASEMYMIRITSKAAAIEAVLILKIAEGSLRSQGSYYSYYKGGAKIPSELEALIFNLPRIAQP
jgi:hypothetical protein